MRGQRGERVDDRQREAAQVRQVRESRSSCPARGDSGSSRCSSRSCSSVLPAQAPQPPPPALRIAADHRGLDDQLFPLPGRAQRAGDDRRLSASSRRRPPTFPRPPVRRRGASIRANPITASSAGSEVSALARLPRRRAPGERQVLGEPDRRQPFDRAAEHREEGAARRMRPACAALEPAGDAGPLERVLEQADIVGGRPQQDRDLVERARRRAPPARIRRAISTHSRPSPGAENTRTSPVGSRSGGWRRANR